MDFQKCNIIIFSTNRREWSLFIAHALNDNDKSISKFQFAQTFSSVLSIVILKKISYCFRIWKRYRPKSNEEKKTHSKNSFQDRTFIVRNSYSFTELCIFCLIPQFHECWNFFNLFHLFCGQFMTLFNICKCVWIFMNFCRVRMLVIAHCLYIELLYWIDIRAFVHSFRLFNTFPWQFFCWWFCYFFLLKLLAKFTFFGSWSLYCFWISECMCKCAMCNVVLWFIKWFLSVPGSLLSIKYPFIGKRWH